MVDGYGGWNKQQVAAAAASVSINHRLNPTITTQGQNKKGNSSITNKVGENVSITREALFRIRYKRLIDTGDFFEIPIADTEVWVEHRRRWTELCSSNGMLRRALRCECTGCEWPDGEMAPISELETWEVRCSGTMRKG